MDSSLSRLREALQAQNVGTEAVNNHINIIQNSRDTIQTVEALKAWLRGKELECMDISEENRGNDCFFVSIKHSVTRAVVDNYNEGRAVSLDEHLAMSVEARRLAVVQLADQMYGDEQHPDKQTLLVRHTNM